MNVFKPEIFQGNITNKRYFEGWYFKHVSKNMENVFSFIPGISLNPENPHAFIQVINGINGNTQYIEYPLSAFRFKKSTFEVQIGDSVFTTDNIVLKINTSSVQISGRLGFSGSVKYPATVFSPGIMGWYSFVPYMECKHGVVSVLHRIDGSLLIDGEQIDFSGGKGYIEKDWGKSFPESWIWLQSNNFENSEACVMMSIAKIPWLGSFFTGFLGFLYYDGTFYPFSTYSKSELTELDLENEKLTISLKSRKHRLKIMASIKSSGLLRAPKSGEMSRHIKESVDSVLEVELLDHKGNQIYKDVAHRAGLEVIEGIFEIVKIKGKKSAGRP
jgi:hypothetical protein